MRSVLTGIVACAALAMAGALGARAAPAFQQSVIVDDAELAGLPRGSQPVILTWERVYALALVRSRAERSRQGGTLAESLDPDDLAARAGRYGVADFARFRLDFLASDAGNGKTEGKFRDPSGEIFALLSRLQAVENAQRNVAVHEQLVQVLRERIQGASSGLSQLDLDRVDAALQQARRSLVDEVRHYRNQLDAFKVELGLSPHAPVVPARESLAAFHDVFAAIEEWSRAPTRVMTDLPRIVAQLPALLDIVIDGRPVFAALDARPDQLEDTLSAAVRHALKDRSDAAAELRVRRRIRHLRDSRLNYELQRRQLVLLIRSADQAFERLMAPAAAGPLLPRTPMLRELIDQKAQMLQSENQLVALWASFQRDRLALCRDLGTLPCDDWNSFYEQLAAKPDSGGQDPRPRPAVPPAPFAPAPPAPPLVPPP